MKSKRKAKAKSKRDLLVGTWISGSEYASEVVFTISPSDGSYTVSLRDGYDGEEAEVFDVEWDGAVLSCASHWKSTGRFARYRLSLDSANRLDVTYTYTDRELYHRKRSRPDA